MATRQNETVLNLDLKDVSREKNAVTPNESRKRPRKGKIPNEKKREKAERDEFIQEQDEHKINRPAALDSSTLVSASTDSQLKLWKCGEGSRSNSPSFSFSGHQNEKNFVGLATDGDYIACGSEDNSLYVYYKSLQRPLIRYRFNTIRSITGDSSARRDDDSSEFLSAVAWRPRSNTLLAANSQGNIKLLALT